MKRRRRFPSAVAGLAAVLALSSVSSGSEARAQAAQTQPVAQYVSNDFCNYFVTLGEASQSGFRELKGSLMFGGSSFRQSKLTLPEATQCVVSAKEDPPLVVCTWEDRPMFKLRSDFEVLATAVKACFPTYKVEEIDFPDSTDKSFDLFFPPGVKGGPMWLSLRLDRKEIAMIVGQGNPK